MDAWSDDFSGDNLELQMKSDSSFNRLTEVLIFKRSIDTLMGTTLYLLRQHCWIVSLHRSFESSDADMDIVFVGHATSIAPSL